MGKAPFIVITGGNPLEQRAVVPEAQRVADFLVEVGAPRADLILETKSRNTRENAVNTAAIFKEHGWRHGFHVTEGVHMPRALATFQKMDLDVTPVDGYPFEVAQSRQPPGFFAGCRGARLDHVSG